MSGNLASDQGSVMVAPKGNDLGGALSTANKVPYVMEKWNVSDPDAYVVWNMSLVDIVEESTCAGFIKSKHTYGGRYACCPQGFWYTQCRKGGN